MGKPFINRTGIQYGRLTVNKFLGRETGKSKPKWECTCSCGNVVQVTSSNLATGHTQSCGCIHLEELQSRRVYSKEDSPEYAIWRGIVQRTGAKKGKNASWYSTVGICPEWKESFEAFLKDMGKRPSDHHSVERVDTTKGYCPDNCVWATAQEQANNRKTNHVIEHLGEHLTIAQWARRYGIKQPTLLARISRYKWSIDAALTTPVKQRN